jgi:hypothetical protein
MSRAEQSRAEQSRAEQSRAEQSRAEQSRAEQSRAEQSRAEQSSRTTHRFQHNEPAMRLIRIRCGQRSNANTNGDGHTSFEGRRRSEVEQQSPHGMPRQLRRATQQRTHHTAPTRHATLRLLAEHTRSARRGACVANCRCMLIHAFCESVRKPNECDSALIFTKFSKRTPVNCSRQHNTQCDCECPG